MISFWISVVPPKKNWHMTDIVLSSQATDIRDVLTGRVVLPGILD